MKLLVYGWLEVFFRTIALWASRYEERFALCPHCGQNRYTGVPCYGGDK